MKFKLYYEKEIDEMVVEIVEEFDSKEPLKKINFKHVITKVDLQTMYFKEGHPRVAQVGICESIEIDNYDSLEIY